MKALWKKYGEFIIYVIVGVITTVLNLVVYAFMNLLIGEKLYQVSNVVAWVVCVTFAYFANKIIVFRSKEHSVGTVLKEAAEFYGLRLISLALESGGLWLLIEVLNFDAVRVHFIIDIDGVMIAKFLMMMIVTISNYVFSKYFIFKDKTTDQEV